MSLVAKELRVNEPKSSEMHKLACGPINDLNPPGHPRSLIRAVSGCSSGSHGSKISSGKKIKTDQTVPMRRLI